jgi:glycerol-3-phosphate acyltransferase PlsY
MTTGEPAWVLILSAVLGYLLGSVPSGLVLTRWAGLGDIRSIGSGNIGATNVLRTGRKGLALATLLFDLAKGALPTYLALRWGGEAAAVLAGAGAILGHCFPVWLGFKGGKGVATAAGVMLGLTPAALLLALAVWVAVVALTGYVSLGSIAAAAVFPVLVWLVDPPEQPEILWLDVAAAAGIIWLHRANIGRLVHGTERRASLRRRRKDGLPRPTREASL